MSATVSVLANASAGSPAEARIAAYDWQALTAELDGLGCAVFPKLLTPKECRAVAGLHPNEIVILSWRDTASAKASIVTASIRSPTCSRRLSHSALPGPCGSRQRVEQAYGSEERFPSDHASLLKQCHDAGQTRPTPLLLRDVPNEFNCLPQDLYGAIAFPIQVAILLSEPGGDFTGGEFAFTERRPPSRPASPRRCGGLCGANPASAG
jgi:uncharacterized protein